MIMCSGVEKTRFQMRPRISIRGSVRPQVGRSVGWLVGRYCVFFYSKNEGFSSYMSSGRPRNITEMQNCISAGRQVCWSVLLSLNQVKKKVKRTHLFVDQTCFLFLSSQCFISLLGSKPPLELQKVMMHLQKRKRKRQCRLEEKRHERAGGPSRPGYSELQ